MAYRNGQIPLSELVPLSVKSPTLGTQYATTRVAAAFERLNTKFSAQFGEDLIPIEGYRSLEGQKLLRAAYLRYLVGGPWAPLAAIAGTSNHGWAEAIDFGSGVATYGTAEKAWLNEHGPEEGFYPTGDRFNPREAWHFDDKNMVPADTGIPTQIPTTAIPEELDDMAEPIYIKGDAGPDIAAFYTNVSDANRPGPGAVYKAKRPISMPEYHVVTALGFPHPKQSELIVIPQAEFDSINTVGA